MADWMQALHDIVLANPQAIGGAAGALGAGKGFGAGGQAFAQGQAFDQQRALQQQQAAQKQAMQDQQNAARQGILQGGGGWVQGLPQQQLDYLGANPALFDQMMAQNMQQQLTPTAPKIIEDASGRQRYADGSFVFEDMADWQDPKLKSAQTKLAGEIRREFSKESGDFKKIAQSYQTIQKAGARQSGAGDMSMVFAFMKMLDPTSVVREGEFAAAKDTAGVPAAIRNQYNKIINGEFLTPAQRNEFLAMAGDVYGTQKSKFDERVDFFTNEANSAGIDVNRIVQDFSKGIDTKTKLVEGTVIRNPTTGEIQILTGGQWVTQ